MVMQKKLSFLLSQICNIYEKTPLLKKALEMLVDLCVFYALGYKYTAFGILSSKVRSRKPGLRP